MAYVCPRCGKAVSRAYSSGAQVAAGLVGALLYAAFGGFQCKTCGKIPRSEFPADVQARMALGTMVMAIVGIGVLVAVIALLKNLN